MTHAWRGSTCFLHRGYPVCCRLASTRGHTGVLWAIQAPAQVISKPGISWGHVTECEPVSKKVAVDPVLVYCVSPLRTCSLCSRMTPCCADTLPLVLLLLMLQLQLQLSASLLERSPFPHFSFHMVTQMPQHGRRGLLLPFTDVIPSKQTTAMPCCCLQRRKTSTYK
jgi:hypothetical protein